MKTPEIPERPSPDGLEARWGARWEADGTYRFDRTRPRAELYGIDTPPPTVSGQLHVGSAWHYTHADFMARYQRMRGRAVLYPMGWDDNGLPTERRVERHFGVRCDPGLDYQPGLEPPGPGHRLAVSRPNFIELCERLTASDEAEFEELWRRLGLSVDWSRTYTTIGGRARRLSQASFLRLLERGEAYQAEAPTLWDVNFQTAVAQAELEDRDTEGIACRIRFGADRAEVVVETTRPELLPACVALVAHPDDARYRQLHGRTVRTPLFGVEVPVLAHRLADPGKGTGIAMVCTFGDVTDVTWWRELRLPVRSVVTSDGRVSQDPPEGVPANGAWAALAGQPLATARDRAVGLLRDSGDLVGEPRRVVHPVKHYEKGEAPLEIVTSRQWFIRLLAHRERLLALGRELTWHPPFMRARYEHWVEGLTGDWLVSRQRFFGVPIPVWYPLRADGSADHDRPLVPAPGRLPVDPSTDVPDGYTAADRGRPGGFAGEADVLDTWATSSLTAELVSGYDDDPELFERAFPLRLRPQGQEIIRTWLFYSVVRSYLEHGELPWSRALVSGWVVDPERRKLSKSRGEALTPEALMERFGADAFRYWGASSRPGADTSVDEQQVRVGRRLAIKLLNASRFALQRVASPEGLDGPVAEPLDRAMLARLDQVVATATDAFEAYDYTRALEHTERFFWTFCDDYLELVKERAYGAVGEPATDSARRALATALSVLQRLLAPVLPYACEEAWSWWQDGSVHRAPWPGRLDAATLGEPLALEAAAAVLAAVRRAKSEARRSLRTPVARLAVRDAPGRLAALATVTADLRVAGNVAEVDLAPGDELAVEVDLAPS